MTHTYITGVGIKDSGAPDHENLAAAIRALAPGPVLVVEKDTSGEEFFLDDAIINAVHIMYMMGDVIIYVFEPVHEDEKPWAAPFQTEIRFRPEELLAWTETADGISFLLRDRGSFRIERIDGRETPCSR